MESELVDPTRSEADDEKSIQSVEEERKLRQSVIIRNQQGKQNDDSQDESVSTFQPSSGIFKQKMSCINRKIRISKRKRARDRRKR